MLYALLFSNSAWATSTCSAITEYTSKLGIMCSLAPLQSLPGSWNITVR